MAPKLTKQYVLQLINEEQSKIVPGLRVKNKNGAKYTVDSVTSDEVILLTPELDRYNVSPEEFKKDYEPA